MSLSIFGDQFQKTMSVFAATNTMNRKWLIVTGGIVSAGLTSYLLYRSYKSKPYSDFSTVSINLTIYSTVCNLYNVTFIQNDDSTVKCSEKLATPERLPFVDYNQTIIDTLDQIKSIKMEGNKLFGEKNYSTAVQRYSKAIDICPKDQPLDLAMLYQNRAAAYEKMVRFAYCS